MCGGSWACATEARGVGARGAQWGRERRSRDAEMRLAMVVGGGGGQVGHGGVAAAGASLTSRSGGEAGHGGGEGGCGRTGLIGRGGGSQAQAWAQWLARAMSGHGGQMWVA